MFPLSIFYHTTDESSCIRRTKRVLSFKLLCLMTPLIIHHDTYCNVSCLLSKYHFCLLSIYSCMHHNEYMCVFGLFTSDNIHYSYYPYALYKTYQFVYTSQPSNHIMNTCHYQHMYHNGLLPLLITCVLRVVVLFRLRSSQSGLSFPYSSFSLPFTSLELNFVPIVQGDNRASISDP